MKKSQKFWMAIYIVALIIIGFIFLPVLFVILFGGSFVALGVITAGEDAIDRNASWFYLMPLTWFIFLFGVVLIGLHQLYENTIKKFNDKMDKNG
jgi:hypothetical protein